ncbi:MAG: ABC transporter permease, partial [Verrucomicrobia bacterium]|nr:ABC transporter permease [Prolixibacteraceae bacterium]
MIEGIFVEGLLYGIMALGVFITFRVLDFPDLTVDGSFPFGAALMAALVVAEVDPWIALVAAFLGGGLAGCVTAAIHTYLKVPNLLAGILTMTILWSINIRVLGNRANVSLAHQDTILGSVTDLLKNMNISSEYSLLFFFTIVALVFKLLLDLFFRTDLGMTLGAMGNNPQMVISTGVNPATMKFIGLGLSNGLVAVAGAFACQFQGFADVNLGQGIIIAGLASVMIGEFVLRSNRIWILTLRVLVGSIIFRGLMYIARYYGYDIGLLPTDQRLITGLLIVGALYGAQLSSRN